MLPQLDHPGPAALNPSKRPLPPAMASPCLQVEDSSVDFVQQGGTVTPGLTVTQGADLLVRPRNAGTAGAVVRVYLKSARVRRSL